VSERNLEIVREAAAAWDRGDLETIESLLSPEVELVPLRAQLEDKVYRGHAGLRQMWDELHADWEQLRLPVERLIDRGDLVVALGRLTARGRASGVDRDVPLGQVWEVRDGAIVRMQAYSDPEDAVRAAAGSG
jgi:uncharacterized protein